MKKNQWKELKRIFTPTKKGCGKKFLVKRFGDGAIALNKEEGEHLKGTFLICGDNFIHKLCLKCQEKDVCECGHDKLDHVIDMTCCMECDDCKKFKPKSEVVE